MTYEEFKTALLQEIRMHFPGDTYITIHSIPRNNQVMQEGLTILESGFNIAPTLYIRDYYEGIKNGLSFGQLLEHLLRDYYEYRPAERINPEFFREFANMKNRIVFRLVHRERNQDLLHAIPHVPYLDLAIVFYCLLNAGTEGNATILIRNSHLELWQTDSKALIELARVNTPFLLSSSCSDISELLNPVKESLEEGEATLPSMFVLTNESRLYGAACILYQDLLADLAIRFSGDFYILPSSIHEVILIPVDQAYSKDYFNAMIKEVNTGQLAQEEILSDHVYYYSQKEKQILA